MATGQKTRLDNQSTTAAIFTERAPAVMQADTSKIVSVLFVEDDEMVRFGLRPLIEGVPGIHVLGLAANGREALQMAEELRPDLVLTDILMPFLDGIALTREVRRRHPDMAVVILTGHADEKYLSGALEAGAAGYLLKGSGVDELGIAIHAVARGEAYVTPRMTKQLLSERLDRNNPGTASHARLTPRQRQTLQSIGEGKTNKEIATSLKVSVKTVEKHRTDLMQRLGVHNTAGLVRYALDNDLI